MGGKGGDSAGGDLLNGVCYHAYPSIGVPQDWVMISRVLDFDAVKVRRALEEARIQFEEKVELDGSMNQFEMHEFYVLNDFWAQAASIADEAVNL